MLAYVFVLIAVAARFLILPSKMFHFTPIGAALLYYGARGSRKRAWIPLALYAAADVVLTTLVYRYPFLPDHFATWLWYAGALWLGMQLRKNANLPRLVGASLVASVSFFLISNFAFWLDGNMYPRTWEGLQVCYVAAIPFFRSTLASDLLFTGAFFGIGALLHQGASEDARDKVAA